MVNTTAASQRDRIVLGWSEKEFQTAVIEVSQVLGYRCYHTFDSRRSHPGFPDLVLWCPHPQRPLVLFRELKAERGRLSETQKLCLRSLASAGADVGVWFPSDWLSGRIEKELRGLR